MTHLQLVTALILCSLLIACEGGETVSATPNENLYGTWIETLTLGEVVFREDGTVNWKGTEGTYEFLYDDGYSLFGQEYPYGSYRISVELPEGWFSDRTFDIRGHGPSDSAPDDWSHEARSFLRKGSFEFPVMPSHFERIPATIADDFSSEDDFDTTTLVLSAGSFLKTSSNQLLFRGNWRFDKEQNQWVKLKCNYSSCNTYVTPLQVYNWNDDRVSLDGGLTWKSVPPIAEQDTFISVPSADIEFIGTDIFSYNHDVCDYMGVGSDEHCDRPELWMVDVTEEQPNLELRSSFDWAVYTDGFLKGARYLNDALIRHIKVSSLAPDGAQEIYFISHDRGLTWADWTPPPHPFDYNAGYVLCDGTYPYGVECDASSESGLYWYDVDTQTWTTHTVDFENVLGVTPNRDGVYFKRGKEVRQWHTDGTKTLITTLPSEKFEASVVGNDLYVSTIFGLWRMNL